MSLILAHAIVGVAAWSAMLSVVAGVLVTLALLALDMWSATRDRFRGVLGLAWVPFIILATFVVAKGVNPGHYQVAVETRVTQSNVWRATHKFCLEQPEMSGSLAGAEGRAVIWAARSLERRDLVFVGLAFMAAVRFILLWAFFFSLLERPGQYRVVDVTVLSWEEDLDLHILPAVEYESVPLELEQGNAVVAPSDWFDSLTRRWQARTFFR